MAALKCTTEVVLSLAKKDDAEELRTVMYYVCIGGHSELVLSEYGSTLLKCCSTIDAGI